MNSEGISSFRSLRAGSQVFAFLMLFPCVILHTMWLDKSLHLLCILPFDILCLSANRIMFENIILAGYFGLTESRVCVFSKLCQVGFLVVCKS